MHLVVPELALLPIITQVQLRNAPKVNRRSQSPQTINRASKIGCRWRNVWLPFKKARTEDSSHADCSTSSSIKILKSRITPQSYQHFSRLKYAINSKENGRQQHETKLVKVSKRGIVASLALSRTSMKGRLYKNKPNLCLVGHLKQALESII